MNQATAISMSSVSRQRWLAVALSLTLFQAAWASGPEPLRPALATDVFATNFLAANDPAVSAGIWDADFAQALLPDPSLDSDAGEVDAPAQELAEGLNVHIGQTRRKFRSRAVSWLTDRAAPVGVLGDLLLGGAETGWHVVVSPGGSDEYMLEWKVKFH